MPLPAPSAYLSPSIRETEAFSDPRPPPPTMRFRCLRPWPEPGHRCISSWRGWLERWGP